MDGAFAADPYPPPGNSQASMRRDRGGCCRKNRGRRKPGGAAAGADLGGSSKYSNENFEGQEGKACPPWKRSPEVGSSGWKSTATPLVSGSRAPFENGGPKVPPTPGRTHNRIRSPRQGKSAKWIRNLGKRIGSGGLGTGSQPQPAGLSVDCSKRSPGRELVVAASGRGRIGNAPLGASPRRTADSELVRTRGILIA
ncbi:hypothetical protein H6P81_021237 [Aristolochia fimbriata]|uniref:Uncharacterized protein n=1 Tax=Aristolochia fimbriata TaxID=158543 RepID=A0AAV7DQK3_ARIFI|nr:hypothetical protein H6P81_021237 [Aristolochia fimbriata]